MRERSGLSGCASRKVAATAFASDARERAQGLDAQDLAFVGQHAVLELDAVSLQRRECGTRGRVASKLEQRELGLERGGRGWCCDRLGWLTRLVWLAWRRGRGRYGVAGFGLGRGRGGLRRRARGRGARGRDIGG
jgi:hypothetical protein